MRRTNYWPECLASALLGGIWGAVLARVLAEMWPLGAAGPYCAPCWLWSPAFRIVLGVLGALGALLLCAIRAPAVAPKRWAIHAWPFGLGFVYLIQPSAAPLWGVGALIAGLAGTLWLQRTDGRSRWTGSEAARPTRTWVESVWGLLAFVLPLALYVSTLAPSVLPGDSGEFQFVAPMLGIPHPTGYPLYLLLGKLFSLLPLRSVAYRLNLLSAVAAAGAVWATYRSGRALGLQRVASLVGAGLLAVSEVFWSQATIAEKYTLNAFFVALTLWLGLEWRRARLASTGQTLTPRTAGAAWAFCYGLSLTHHRTMLLLAPAYVYMVWVTERRFRLGSVRAHLDRRIPGRLAVRGGCLVLLVLAPLSLYLLLPLFSARQPPYAYIRLNSARAFLDLVLARDYQGALFRGGWASLPERFVELFRLASRQFGPIGLAAAVAGWVVLWRSSKRLAYVLVLGIVAQILFALNYYVPNAFVYYLPAFVWLALCIAVAINAIATDAIAVDAVTVGAVLAPPLRLDVDRQGDHQLQRGMPGRLFRLSRSAWPHMALAIVLVVSAWPMALLEARLPRMDRRQTYSRLAFDHTYGQMAAWFVEPGALVVSDWMPATVLWYTQWVEGQMPTAQVAVVDPLEGGWAGPVGGALASGRPVYLARPLMAAGDRYSLTSAGPLVRVLDEPLTLEPKMSHPASRVVIVGEDIRLLGSDLVATMPGAEGSIYVPSDGVIRGGSTLHVTVYWQALQPPAGDASFVVRLVDSAGYSWVQRRNRHPVGGTYPTSRWRAGEVVGDHYELTLPPYLPSGEYQLSVSVGVLPEASVDALLAMLFVHKPLRWPRPLVTRFGGAPVLKLYDDKQRVARELVLVGYDAPRELAPGETVSIALQWLVCGRNAIDSVSAGAVAAARPRLVLVLREGTEMPLTSTAASMADWQPGALVVDPYTFFVPDDLARVEVQSALEGGRRVHLPLRVATAPPSGTNFGDLVRLRGHRYGDTSLHPGDTVHLTLEWQALKTMDEAFKVFVHVLGPDGLPIAQQDNEPVHGTYPTTQWQSGERITDPYAIRLPGDLSPGEYPVEVGLYRISDLSRLPVLDENRSVVDDKVFLEPLTVK